MKEMLFGGLAVVGVGLSVYFAPPMKIGTFERLDTSKGTIFSMTPDQASGKLAAADTRRGKAPFYKLDVAVTRASDNVVTFMGNGSHARVNCRAIVHDVGSGRVQVESICNRAAPSDGAAAAAANDLDNIAFQELVDSTLAGRAYNDDMVRTKSAGAVMKNLPQMQREALKMDMEMRQAEVEHEVRQEDAEMRAWLEGDVE